MPSPAESTRAERWSVLSKPPPPSGNGMTPDEEAARREALLAQIRAMTTDPEGATP